MPKWKIATFYLLLGSSITLLILKLFLGSADRFWSSGKAKRTLSEDTLVEAMYRVLFDYAIRVEWMSEKEDAKVVRLPADLLPIELYVELAATLQDLGGQLLRAESTPDGDRMLLEVGSQGMSYFQLTLVADKKIKRTAGSMAIVVEGFGGAFDSDVRDFLNLDQPITLCVMPGSKYAQRIAEEAFANDHELVVHLPSGSQNGRSDDAFELSAEIDAAQIRNRIRQAIRGVPRAKGLSNHLGSVVSENEKMAA
ncbi:divergent polysaccharide deacetylase family protein, partial [bacterium]|nr:divergent polysaccharide deacetylase family protein [bacterium]